MFTPNWQRGKQYFWVPQSALAICFLGRGLSRAVGIKAVPAFVDKPRNGVEYHRVHLTVVRTKKETERLRRKWEKIGKRASLGV